MMERRMEGKKPGKTETQNEYKENVESVPEEVVRSS